MKIMFQTFANALLVSSISTFAIANDATPLAKEELLNGQLPFLAKTLAQQTRFFSDTGCPASNDVIQEKSQIIGLSADHHIVVTSIVINASAQQTWSVLTDFDNMSSWSSSTLQGITGDIRDGEEVEVSFLLNEDLLSITHNFIFEEGEFFGWSDPFDPPLDTFRDNHIYRVAPLSECQTLFIQSDEFVGSSDFLTGRALAAQLTPEYQLFNRELKAQVELLVETAVDF